MSVVPYRFGPKATVTTFSSGATGAYTATAAGVVKQIIICNTSASTAYWITAGVAANSVSSDVAAQRILSQMSVSPKETITYNTNTSLALDDIIYFVSENAAITVTVNGYTL